MKIWHNAKCHTFPSLRFWGHKYVWRHLHPGNSGVPAPENPARHFTKLEVEQALVSVRDTQSAPILGPIFGSSSSDGAQKNTKETTNNDDNVFTSNNSSTSLKKGVKPFVGPWEAKSLGLKFEGGHHRGIMEVL